MGEERRLTVATMTDVGRARREARALAGGLGFPPIAAEAVVLAASELATNLVHYAERGTLTLSALAGPAGVGLQLESRDAGPGIVDVALALHDGYSTSGGLGGGLGGVRRLMDEFEIESDPTGTRIVARKWLIRPS